MTNYKAIVKEAFGMEYFVGNELKVIAAVDYPGYYCILHPVTGEPTTELVATGLLDDIVEIEQAA